MDSYNTPHPQSWFPGLGNCYFLGFPCDRTFLFALAQQASYKSYLEAQSVKRLGKVSISGCMLRKISQAVSGHGFLLWDYIKDYAKSQAGATSHASGAEDQRSLLSMLAREANEPGMQRDYYIDTRGLEGLGRMIECWGFRVLEVLI